MADLPDIRAAAFESAPAPQLVIDPSGRLAAANRAARALLGVSEQDLGRPVRDLDVCVRLPQLAAAADAPASCPDPQDVQWPSGRDVRVLRLTVSALAGGVHCDFADVTDETALRLDLQGTTQELAAAYRQLGATTEQLRTANERLTETVDQLEAATRELRRIRGDGV